jgi:uncharacterized protein
MTPDEKTLLTSFLNDLAAKPVVSKDAEAAGMINDAVGRNPDAAYLLVQHAIVSDRALHAAQARIGELENQLRQQQAPVPAPQGSFTSSFAGPWGQSPAAQAAPAPSAFSSGGGSGLGSFLRQAGTTAAGVAGGEFLFEGLSNMFGGRGGGFGGGYGGEGFLGGGQENVTINNFNDDGGGDYDGGGSFDDGSGGNW